MTDGTIFCKDGVITYCERVFNVNKDQNTHDRLKFETNVLKDFYRDNVRVGKIRITPPPLDFSPSLPDVLYFSLGYEICNKK